METSSQKFQPLKGKTIIDLTQVLAGPYATYQLALLGADVIKVEDPRGGDWTREGSAPPGLENQNMGTAYLTQNCLTIICPNKIWSCACCCYHSNATLCVAVTIFI